MKKHFRRICRTMLAALLSITLVMSYSVASFAAAGQAKDSGLRGGVFATLATGEINKIASAAIDRAVMAGLKQASSLSQDTPFSKVFDVTRKVLGGGQAVALQNILKACQQIQQQISALDVTVRSASAHTDSLIAKLNVEIAQNDFSDKQKELRAFRDKYEGVMNTFAALNAVLDQYCRDVEDPSVSESTLASDLYALKAAYNNVEALCRSAAETSGSETSSVNFTDDLTSFLELISPYPANRSINAGDDLSDSSYWGSRSNSEKTYLDYAHSFYETQVVGENQMYDLMSASMSEAASPLISYLSAYSMYAGYKAYKLCTDPAYAGDETSRQAGIQDIWTKYYAAQNRAIRGFYQMNSLYEPEMLRLMRSFDTSQIIKMHYYAEEEHTVRDGVIGSLSKTLKATDKTARYRNFYVVKPYGTGSVYAISKWGGQNIFSDDMAYEYTMDEHCMSQDYFNLQKSEDSDLDMGFRTIGYGKELGDLTSTNAWMLSGYFLDDYLRYYAGFDDLADLSAWHRDSSNNKDALKAGAFAILNESRVDNNVWHDSKDNHVVFLNVSMKMEVDLSANEVDLDTNDLYEEMSSTPINIIMKNVDVLKRPLNLETEGASAQAYIGDSMISGKNVVCGSTLELRIYPDSGKIVDKIQLFDRNNNLIDTEYSSTETVNDPDTGKTSTSFDVSSTLYQMDDGGYQFKMSVPYQTSTIRITCRGENSKSYEASLDSSLSGDLEFESHMGLSAESYNKGDTVTVYARPYQGCAFESITVKDAKTGNKLDLNITEEKDARIYSASEKAFSFKMPAQDVSIGADFEKGSTVSFDTDHFVKNSEGETICYLAFEDSRKTEEWDETQKTFKIGNTASFECVCDSSYYFSSVKAVGVKSGKEYELKTDDGKNFSLVVGEEDILVTPEYVAKQGRDLATIKDEYPQQGRMAFFSDENGNSLEESEKLYMPGETILLNVTDERLFTCNFAVRDSEGNDITHAVDLQTDEDLKIVTLKMPAQDIFIIVPEVHNYVNGICRDEGCLHYQNPSLDADGVYQIANAGNLFWLSSLVRNDHTHATFDNQNKSPKAELTCDIDLENRQWEPIGTAGNEFSGTFEGSRHTIDNFYFHASGEPSDSNMYYGLFGMTDGATIQNFSLRGKAELEYPDSVQSSPSMYFGSIVCWAKDRTVIDHVNSYVDIEAGNTGCQSINVGGIVYYSYFFTNIDGCVNFGSISGDLDAGGVTNALWKGDIYNSANIGNITYSGSNCGKNIGGVCEEGVDPDHACATDSYNYGKLTGNGASDVTIISKGWKNSSKNCYYLDTSSTDKNFATGKTSDQFKSGEAGWLLNKGVTDGTQAWYQNIDNGRTPDDYPLPDNTRGTIYYIESEGRYSNYPDGKAPEKPKEFAIRTYEDLTEFARLVNEEYDSWKDASAWLENNIIAPADSVWESGIGSVSDNKPFNGSFDGKGYCIAGLNIKGGDSGGLFEWIGSDGSVSDLNLYDCDYTDSASTAGGIAAVNDGNISYCVNGVNLTSGVYVKPDDGSLISTKQFNSIIKGTIAGGIAAKNNGTIYACRSAAEIHFDATGSVAGSIAGVNKGTVSNCAGNSTVFDEGGDSYAGGLSGANAGTVKGGYSSALFSENGVSVRGSLSGYADKGTFIDAYYTTSENQTPYGTEKAASEQNINGLRRGEMMTDDFLTQLGQTDSNSVTWIRNDAFNAGLPRISHQNGSYVSASLESSGVKLKGTLHRSAGANVTKLSPESEAWKLLEKEAAGRTPVSAYAVDLKDAAGKRVPTELWAQSALYLTAPAGKENVSIVILHIDGNVEIRKPLLNKDNKVLFPSGSISAFMIVKETPISKASIAAIAKRSYTGKAITPAPVVTLNGKTLVKGRDYKVSYKNNKAVGKATVTVTGIGGYTGTKTATFRIVKATPQLSVSDRTVKYSSVKKKSLKVRVFTLKKAYGKVTYKKIKGSKRLSVTDDGRIRIKKGTPKGKYYIKVRIKVRSTGKNKYKSFKRTVRIKVG